MAATFLDLPWDLRPVLTLLSRSIGNAVILAVVASLRGVAIWLTTAGLLVMTGNARADGWKGNCAAVAGSVKQSGKIIEPSQWADLVRNQQTAPGPSGSHRLVLSLRSTGRENEPEEECEQG